MTAWTEEFDAEVGAWLEEGGTEMLRRNGAKAIEVLRELDRQMIEKKWARLREKIEAAEQEEPNPPRCGIDGYRCDIDGCYRCDPWHHGDGDVGDFDFDGSE